MIKLQGWPITFWVTFFVWLSLAIFFGVSNWNSENILVMIRTTGRISLFLFSIAFMASSLYSYWKIPTFKWILRNRRYIGVSFAVNHFTHLALIITIAIDFPEPFLADQAASQWLFGGIGYVFIALMALTSSDRAQQWLGFKRWKKLHLVGSYYIWLIFFMTYIKHTKQDLLFYMPWLIFVVLVLVFRLFVHFRLKKN